jgi:hypothetical protein
MNHDPHGLIAAAQANDLDAIRGAAQKGATMLDTDAHGQTALWHAAEAGRTETVQTLLEVLPVTNLMAEQKHITACAENAGSRGHAKTLEILGGTGAIDTPNWERIQEGAKGPARSVVDPNKYMPAPKRLPSSLELGSQGMDAMRESQKMEAWHAQQVGMSL